MNDIEKEDVMKQGNAPVNVLVLANLLYIEYFQLNYYNNVKILKIMDHGPDNVLLKFTHHVVVHYINVAPAKI